MNSSYMRCLPERAELSDTKGGDKHCQIVLSASIAVGCIGGVELIGVTDPDQVRVVLEVVELTSTLFQRAYVGLVFYMTTYQLQS